MTVRGLKRSTGKFQGNNYDNMLIYCDCENYGSMLFGDPVDIIKIKTPVFDSSVKRMGLMPKELIGCKIRVFYNSYGNAEDFEVLK